MDHQSSRLSRRKFLESSLGVAAAGAVLSGCQEQGGPTLSNRHDQVPWIDEIQQPQGEDESRPSPQDRADAAPARTLVEWDQRRTEIREQWLEYLGPLEPTSNPPRLKVIEEDRPTGVVRQLVTYEGEPGLRVRGYLLKPQMIGDPRPGIVALHSTVDHTIRQPAGVEGNPAKAFGLHLAQMGFVVFCPECFLWHEKGDRDYYEQTDRFFARHPDSTGMAKMLFDARRGLDVLESLEIVDPERLGTIGHSLGAKEALYLAAFDERIQAAVSSEGGIGIEFSNWDAPWYLGEGISAYGHDHEELLALIAPRPFLLIGGDSADGTPSWPYIEAALQVYQLFERRPPIGLLNHHEGHSVPRVAEHRAYQWLLTYV